MHMYRMQLNWAMLIHRRVLTRKLEKVLKNLTVTIKAKNTKNQNLDTLMCGQGCKAVVLSAAWVWLTLSLEISDVKPSHLFIYLLFISYAWSQPKPKSSPHLHCISAIDLCSYETHQQSQTLDKEFFSLALFYLSWKQDSPPTRILLIGCRLYLQVPLQWPATNKKSHRAESAGLGLPGAVFVHLRLAGAKSVGIWLVRAEIVGMRTNQMCMCWNCRWATSTSGSFGWTSV